ncbi:MAG TPA: type II toxin-antitoxin system VapC family toxin [Treponemataceae bacterium]|nr:type II toxin-antitoxin system VapC family toxin [Treponemataceae bacterium]
MYYLDTNTCIYFLNGRYESIKHKIVETSPNKIKIPSIVKAELLLGGYNSKNKTKTLATLEQFLEPFEVISFTEEMTYTYAEIRSTLEKKGQIIGPNDVLIASIVLFYSATLITHNVQEFKRIPALKIEDWVLF